MTQPVASEHRVRFQPPVLFVLTLVAGVLLHWLLPVELRPPAGAAWLGSGIGGALLAAAILLAGWALATLGSARTPVNPNLPPVELVTTGPYRFSRNPIYLAFCLGFAGLGLVLANGWLLLLIVPAVVLLNRGVIAQEERKLAAHYGAAFDQYRARVRRWI